MSNLFDGLQATVQNIITNAMGYDAVWMPSAGGSPITGRVLFNIPTIKSPIESQEYQVDASKMEYLSPAFPGLFEAVQGLSVERITIEGTIYSASNARKLFDGKTIVIDLEPV